MEQKFSELLEKDEKLLWCGCPEHFETLDKTNKKSIIVGLIIKAIVIVGILALYIHGALMAAGVKWGIVAAVLAFGAYAFVNPLLVARRLRNKTFYALSDRRILRTGLSEALRQMIGVEPYYAVAGLFPHERSCLGLKSYETVPRGKMIRLVVLQPLHEPSVRDGSSG